MKQLHTYESSDAVEPPPTIEDSVSAVSAEALTHGSILGRRRKVEEADMDITPMIDVTFLLLIFFMVASKIDYQADVNLPVAVYGQPVAMGEAVVLTIADGGLDGSALVYKGDTTDSAARLKSTDPRDQEEEITQYVQETMIKQRKRFVVIKAAKTVKHRDVARVANAVGRAESVQALHVAVMESS